MPSALPDMPAEDERVINSSPGVELLSAFNADTLRLNHIISMLLDAGALPTLAQQVDVSGSGGHLMIQPIWKELPSGDRYLSSLIIKGVAPHSP